MSICLRWVAPLALGLLAVGFLPVLSVAVAQPVEPDPPAAEPDVTEWKIGEVIQAASDAGHAVFIYDSARLGEMIVTTNRTAQRPTDMTGWFRLLGQLLAQVGYSYIKAGDSPRVYHVVRIDDILRVASFPVASTPAELPEDAYWGTLVVPLRHTDAAAMQRALLNLVSRPGGMVTPISSANAVLICDVRHQLDRLYALVKLLDAEPPAGPVAEPAPADADTASPIVLRRVRTNHAAPAAVIYVLRELFENEMRAADRAERVTLATMPAQKDRADGPPGDIFIRGPQPVVELLIAAIETIDSASAGKNDGAENGD